MGVVIDILTVIGSLGIFIYGMKLMSEGIQKVAGKGLRNLLSGMTRNRFTGILTGFATTSIVQSSSATTVMVVSFVNAGLLSLVQASGVIMGANIGTTVTAWLVTIIGFKFKISVFALSLVAFSFPLLFAKRDQLKNLAEFIIGFGILFIGLDLLKDSVPDLRSQPEVLEFLNQFVGYGYGSVLFFIMVGTLLTITVQSSSATMAITLVLIAKGFINFETGAAMVLGENIGTTITANLAAIVGNVHAKRAARFHTMFNIIGVLWMLAVFYPFLNFIDWLNQQLFHPASIFDMIDSVGDNPEHIKDVKAALTDGLALYHSVFNILNTALLFFFTPLMLKLIVRLSPAKTKDQEGFRLQYISSGMMGTPELSLQEARKELQLFGKLVEKMCANVMVMLFKTPRNREKLYSKISDREVITDRLQNEITQYLAKLGQYKLSEEGADQAKSMMRIANDMERMGDIFFKLAINKRRLDEQKREMPESVRNELDQYFDLIYKAIKEMNRHVEDEDLDLDMEAVFESEDEIDDMRDYLKKVIYERMEKNQYEVEDGIMYLDFVNSAEKLGDHIVNVNQALAGMK